MSRQTLVFLKQLVDNADYANEEGVLRVIELAAGGDAAVIEGNSYADGALDTLVRLIELRPDLLSPTVRAELERLAQSPNPRVSSAARAALETRTEEATPERTIEQPFERTKPASARSGAFLQVRKDLEAQYPEECSEDDDSVDIHSALRQHVEKTFAAPEWPYKYFLTPGELCDLVDCYADQLIVRIDEKDRRLGAISDLLVRLTWRMHPSLEGITLVGMYAFDSPRQARDVWGEMGVYSHDTPVERMLDIRDRFALNFQSGTYFFDADDVDEIDPSDLWPRLHSYSQAIGAPLP